MEQLAAKITLLWGWPRAAVAFLAGAFLVGALAPFDFPAVAFLSFTVLVWLLDGATGDPHAGVIGRIRPAFAIGWWFGFGYFVAGLWWIGNALLVEADAFAWALPLAVVGLPAILAFFFAFATAFARIWWRDGPSRIAALSVSFALMELARANVFTGFPWNPVGFALAPVPVLMQSVSIIGVTGLNAAAVFIFAMPATLVSQRFRRTGVTAAVVLAVLHVGYGAVRLAVFPVDNEDTITVRLVQPSVKQTEKWDNEKRNEIFSTIMDLTTETGDPDAGKPQLIVWPETAVPFLFTERPDALAAIGDALTADQTLLTGAVRVEGGGNSAAGLRVYNSILAINSEGVITAAADKLHLVPFGEYLPFSDYLSEIGLSQLVEGPGGFKPGATFKPLNLPGEMTALPFICYEIIFSDPELWAEGVAFAINVTNDAWYGRTPGPYQHLRHAQVRAVELGIPVIRAANNGVSALIGADGRILDALDLDVQGALNADLPLNTIHTGFVRWRAKPGFLLIFLIAVFAVSTGLTQQLRSD